MSNKKLGRGLGAIFGDDLSNVIEDIQQGSSSELSGKKMDVLLSEIRSNPYQPRKTFDQEKITELAISIKQHGVFTPILIRQSINGYELVAGERRVIAAREVGLETVPAILVDFDDDSMMEIGLLENIQREDLNVIEEANAYSQMMDKLELTQNDLSQRVGKTREHIANIVRLLKLPTTVQNMVVEKKLTMSHVRPLITLEDKDEIEYYAKEIVEKGLSVRAVESLMRADKEPAQRQEKPRLDPQLLDVERGIATRLSTKVKINPKNIQISYNDISDLNRILGEMGLLED
ncbi:MAG: ParB/RepB/Spo0J family partition protein [Erysipelothrix sp.]|nr:ParB/RepB/Spo0J family partition protein [Erysipelothrix sp.]